MGEMSELDIVKSKSLSSLVREQLERMIGDGALEPGQRLSEQSIAELTGVSRGPVREAFRALVSSGLLVLSRHKGVMVRKLDPREIADLYELRSVLEGKIAEKVAALHDEALLQTLDDIVSRMENCAHQGDQQAFFQLNVEFHDAIFAACSNAALVSACRGAMWELRLARRRNFFDFGSMEQSAETHRRLAKLLRAGRASDVRRAFEAHVLDGMDRLQRGLGSTPIDAGPAEQTRTP